MRFTQDRLLAKKLIDENVIGDIYYGESLVSKETIIEKYLKFFADSLVSKERTINFALHTGSICFDVISWSRLL